MEIIGKKLKKETFVRIIIGTGKTGEPGMKAPTLTLRVKSEDVKEVYDKIVGLLENESK